MTDSDTDVVRAYHERTKHRLDGYARGPEYLDWESQPDPFRVYSACHVTELPLLEQQQLAGRTELKLETVAYLLELSLGLSAWKQYGPDRWALRCNPSSGNLHPTEGYVIAQSISGLADGVYHYAAYQHALELRGEISNPANPSPSLLIGLSSIIWREAWKYGERAYRYVQLDVGHAIAAIKYAASCLSLQVSVVDIDDDALAELLGINRTQDYQNAEREHPDVLLKISTEDGDQHAAIPDVSHWTGQANLLGGDPCIDWKVLQQVASACWKSSSTHKPTSDNPASESHSYHALQTCLQQTTQPLSALIRQRRSGQAFRGKTSEISADNFFAMLNSLLPVDDITSPQYWDFASMLHPIIFVHRVNGVEPGLYAFPRHQGAKNLMQQLMHAEFKWQKPPGCPEHMPLYLLTEGDQRKQARMISCHQEIASSSTFSLGMLAEFEKGLEYGAATYRQLFWEAGFLGHHLYLQAETIGKRGTGIGCFFDDSMHLLTGLNDFVFQDMYHFTVGDPILDSRLQTLPPYQHLARYQQQLMARLKAEIAALYQQRETLKQQISSNAVNAAVGLRKLEQIDAELSTLDSDFKQLWDTQQ